jgi:hypothetical protein
MISNRRMHSLTTRIFVMFIVSQIWFWSTHLSGCQDHEKGELLQMGQKIRASR